MKNECLNCVFKNTCQDENIKPNTYRCIYIKKSDAEQICTSILNRIEKLKKEPNKITQKEINHLINVTREIESLIFKIIENLKK